MMMMMIIIITRAPVCSLMFWWESRIIVGAQLERVSWAARCIYDLLFIEDNIMFL